MTFDASLDRYVRRFGEPPPAIVFWGMDPVDAVDRMERAVLSGRKIPDEEISKDRVV